VENETMNRLLRSLVPLVFALGCDDTLRVAGGDDAGHDAAAPLPIDAYVVPDAPPVDAAPECTPGTASCEGGQRRICASESGSFQWIAAPCGLGQACEGEGTCEAVGGLDLADRIAATAWAHPDIGVTEASATSAGADRFAHGIVVANVSSTTTQLLLGTEVMSISQPVGPHAGYAMLGPWWDRTTLAASLGMAAAPPTHSSWEPTFGIGFLESSLPVAVWGTSPSDARAVADPICTGPTPAPSCRARTFEGTLLSGADGTAFVVVSAPVEAWWDSCTSEVIVEGVPSIGIAHAQSGTVVLHVTASTEIEAADTPIVPIAESAVPGPIAAGETLDTALYRGVYQLVARAPATEAECAALAGTGCRQPCAARDPTGTILSASLAVSAVATHDCSRLRPGIGACGWSSEALLPTSMLGTAHVVPGPLPWESEVRVRIVSTADGTTLDGIPTTLAAGEHLDVDVTTGLSFVSSAPVAVVRTSRRSGTEGRTAAVALLAIERWAMRHFVPRIPSARAVVVTTVGASVEIDGVAATDAAVPLGDGVHEVRVVTTEGGAGASTIDTSTPALVLTAVVPEWSASFSMARGARR
jgi:hypothetical protein